MSKKQDVCVPRTPTDLERKYDFSKINSGSSDGTALMQIQQLRQTFLRFSATVNAEINNLKNNDWNSEGIVDLIYPIGSVFTTITDSDPKDLFGGTWEQIEGINFGDELNETIKMWKRINPPTDDNEQGSIE